MTCYFPRPGSRVVRDRKRDIRKVIPHKGVLLSSFNFFDVITEAIPIFQLTCLMLTYRQHLTG